MVNASSSHMRTSLGLTRCILRLLGVVSFIASCNSVVCRADTYCAYEVTVIQPTRQPSPGVPVAILDQGKQSAEYRTDASGRARLCDAPLSAIDIAVGYDLCGSVVIRRLRPTWPTTRHITVTYTESWCDHFRPPDRCQILLRIQGRDGRPIENARFRPQSSSVSRAVSSDRFGRLFFMISTGETVTGDIIVEGWQSRAIAEGCTASGETDIERVIVLTKQAHASSPKDLPDAP